MRFENQGIGKSRSLVCSPLGDELLVYDSASGKVHVLNKTAHRLWKWLDSGIPADTMVDQLCALYDGVSRETVQQDVQRILRTFVEAAIVIPQTEAAAPAR
jgi:PqqD family protein of HPr-rel-A system